MSKWQGSWNNAHLTPKRKPKAIDPDKPLTEEEHQTRVVVWLEKRGLLFFALPNGGQRSRVAGARLKRTGMRAGVPDLMICEPRGSYAGLFLEMKKEKGGVLSDAQRFWIEHLNKQGYMATVAKGHNQAIEILEAYFEMKKWST